jgi:dolichol-phosphate mannosyltransferase
METSLPRPERPLVSLIIPALNESANLPHLISRVCQIQRSHPTCEFEVVLIDDGSSDGTSVELMSRDYPFAVTNVRLSRNFGSHYAISAGFRYAKGDCAVVLGADLQEPPSLLTDFLKEWRAGADVVWGVRRSRVGRTWISELPSRLFSHLFTRYARLENYPPEGPSGVLLDRLVIQEVVKLPERNRNVLALIAWLGFSQKRVLYDQEPRRHGQSGWTRSKMIKLATDSLLQFSSMPLRACSLAGVSIAALGLLYAAVLIIRSLTGVSTPSGWPTLLVVVLFLGGTQLTVIGIMGEYLWRAVEEVRARPLYVVWDVKQQAARDDEETGRATR